MNLRSNPSFRFASRALKEVEVQGAWLSVTGLKPDLTLTKGIKCYQRSQGEFKSNKRTVDMFPDFLITYF